MHQHDGYLPHSHEVRPDHKGVGRDKPDTPEDRWQALKDYLGQCIEADEAVRIGMVADGEHELAAPFGGLVSANRSTLAKMRELEADK